MSERKYPAAFERYWKYVNTGIDLPEIRWVAPQVKRVAYNAWLAGHRHQGSKRQ